MITFKNVKTWYDRKIWTKSMVADAVRLGHLTPDEYKKITEDDYVVAAEE